MCLCFEICALCDDVNSVLYLVIFVFYVVMQIFVLRGDYVFYSVILVFCEALFVFI